MSHNAIGLLKANGQINEYANNLGGGGDTSTLANKTDITDLQLTGTTNSTGSTITSGTWFYLNGVLVKAKADIANGATFTENTNYEAKTVGDELSELNSNFSYIGTTTTSSNTQLPSNWTQLYVRIGRASTETDWWTQLIYNIGSGNSVIYAFWLPNGNSGQSVGPAIITIIEPTQVRIFNSGYENARVEIYGK